MPDYHELRNKLMHSDGTPAMETFLLVIPSFFYTFIATSLTSLLMSFFRLTKLKRFILEFTIIIIPSILTITVFSKYIYYILIYLLITSVILAIFISRLKPARKRIIIDKNQNDFVTNARSTINVLSVIAILAVDFQVFPRTYTKTIAYGYSLMDLGVGLYVFSNGIVAPEVAHRTDSLGKSFTSALPLLVLGVTRFLVTKEMDYHVPVMEYGVHWNFFISLALTKIFTSLILNSVNLRYLWVNALLLIISHEAILQAGLKNLVLRDIKRNNILLANKEGLVSSIGYISLHLMSVYCGYILNLRNSCVKDEKKVKIITRFFVISVISLSLSLILNSQFGISRRLANSAYCFWVLFIGIFMTGLFYLAEISQRYIFREKLIHSVFTPFIFEAINYNGLVFFLVSNLMTGLINVLCDTLKVGNITSIMIIVIYMFVNCCIICHLFVIQLKVKL